MCKCICVCSRTHVMKICQSFPKEKGVYLLLYLFEFSVILISGDIIRVFCFLYCCYFQFYSSDNTIKKKFIYSCHHFLNKLYNVICVYYWNSPLQYKYYCIFICLLRENSNCLLSDTFLDQILYKFHVILIHAQLYKLSSILAFR